MPADWFPRETHGMLELYCDHLTAARNLSRLIDRGFQDGLTVKEMKELLAAREAESRIASSHATRLRITQQSGYSADKKRGVLTVSNPKPWEGK
jgi:hypothetical protein